MAQKYKNLWGMQWYGVDFWTDDHREPAEADIFKDVCTVQVDKENAGTGFVETVDVGEKRSKFGRRAGWVVEGGREAKTCIHPHARCHSQPPKGQGRLPRPK